MKERITIFWPPETPMMQFDSIADAACDSTPATASACGCVAIIEACTLTFGVPGGTISVTSWLFDPIIGGVFGIDVSM